MTDSKPIASLTPGLLARKGAARPAMRSQLQPMQQFHEATARLLDDPSWNDLGFNDHGDDNVAPLHQGEVVELKAYSEPEVLRQQGQIADRIKQAAKRSKPRRSALADGRSAAFTLRLDADRHLALRLACTLANRSAQQLVTEALDTMIANLPDVADLASRAAVHNCQKGIHNDLAPYQPEVSWLFCRQRHCHGHARRMRRQCASRQGRHV
jgi:predicted HicB family RNase H-like nuclease